MKDTISEKRLITAREAADAYSIGVKQMRRLAEAHLGEFSVYFGNRFMISPQRFEEFLFATKKVTKFKEESEYSAEGPETDS